MQHNESEVQDHSVCRLASIYSRSERYCFISFIPIYYVLEIRDSQNLAKLGLGGQLIFILMICEVVTQ